MDHCISKTTLLIIITISTLFVVTNAVPATRNIHIVRRERHLLDLSDFCKKTTNPDLCTKTIQPFFQNGGVDRIKALQVEVDATNSQTKKTVGEINTLLSKNDINKSTKSSLSTCKNQYNSMLDSIRDTKNALARNDVVTAKFKFSAVLSFQAACKDEFKGEAFPFPQDSDTVYQLGGNCLDIIADMEKDAPPAPIIQSPPSAFSSQIGTIS
ncbi:hypothetical protein VNO77_25472 [Canavalia gladiata]|uniref:Pectinesterase inhibitor domain-containing protein n=1 Tax=Canavalia gladiata TaxID=3824 RepID=A0AAN9LAP1_CANGL